MNPTDLQERVKNRFWSKVLKLGPNKCWGWTAALSDGYGQFSIGGTNKLAHRISMQFKLNRPLKSSEVIDHICRNRSCVNPAHLRIVTKGQNTLENSVGITATNKAKTHCKHGHLFSKENTAINKCKQNRVHRVCRICMRARVKKYGHAYRYKSQSRP